MTNQTSLERPVKIIKVDYHNEQQANDMVDMLDAYARDPMGGGEPLSIEVQRSLPERLAKLSYAHSWVAYVDGEPAGVLNAFEGFSTFKAKPLLNIHDIAVKSDFRGLQLSQKLLEAAEQQARESGCCKITLEVLSKNEIAQNSYRKFGFEGYELDPAHGHALFWQKPLSYTDF